MRKLTRELRVAQVLADDYRYEVDGVDIHKASQAEIDALRPGSNISLYSSQADDSSWYNLALIDMDSAEAYGRVKALFGDENAETDEYKLAWAYFVIAGKSLVEVSDYKCHGCHLRFDHKEPLADRKKALNALRTLIQSSPGVPVSLTFHYDDGDGRTQKWAPK